MSHKATIKTKISDLSVLCETLKQMGIEFETAKAGEKLEIESRYNVQAKVDVKLIKDSHGQSMKSIGFRKESDGTYVAEGDLYEIRGSKTKEGESLSDSSFKRAVAKRYAYFKAMSELTKNGLTMLEGAQDFTASELNFVFQTV